MDHEEDAEITQQKREAMRRLLSDTNLLKDILLRDILQMVQQKRNEEMQNSPIPANEKKTAITHLKLKRRPCIINLV